jgi:ABC-type xylose transport system permease subunit
MVIIFGIIINIINVGNCILFEIMQIFERNHSRNEATSAKFLKFFIMQYLVISVIILFVSFKAESYEDFKFMGFIPMFQGQYPDFTAMWFYDVGSTICLTLTMNIVSPHVSKISIVLLFLLVRCRDRHWKFSEKDPKFELEDED